jgi:hypothetical protein
MGGKKFYCICGGQKWDTIRGKRRLMPCYWRYQQCGSNAPVGTGQLGYLHPQCLIASGLFGLFDTATQTRFENGFREFLEKRARKYILLKALYNTIPSPVATRPNKDADFNPTRYTPNGVPQSFSEGIMQIILTACQLISSSTTLDDLDSGRTFNGTLRGLWNTMYMEDKYPFIDEMRGITQAKRTETKEVHAAFNETQPEYKGAHDKERINSREIAKRRRIKHEIANLVAGTFQVSDQEFDSDRLLMADPNFDHTDQAKALFRIELGIDENWTPREEANYNAAMRASLTHQVVHKGLILSEAILQFGQHYALHGTLTHPLGPMWKKINGHQGILVAAKTLQERAGMFPDVELKKLDTCVWFTLCLKGVINRTRIKNWGKTNPIPEGTIIYVALIHTESVYYQTLETFAHPRMGCAPHHEMYAIHNCGPFVIPSQWVKFVYHKDIAPTFEKLPYTQPNVTSEDFVDVVFS